MTSDTQRGNMLGPKHREFARIRVSDMLKRPVTSNNLRHNNTAGGVGRVRKCRPVSFHKKTGKGKKGVERTRGGKEPTQPPKTVVMKPICFCAKDYKQMPPGPRRARVPQDGAIKPRPGYPRLHSDLLDSSGIIALDNARQFIPREATWSSKGVNEDAIMCGTREEPPRASGRPASRAEIV